jgi:predicted nucleic acid-binding protein
MSVTVIDASAIAAILLQEAGADALVARLEGKELKAPSLLSFEFANVCAVKARRFPEKRQALLEALATFERMDIETFDIEVADVFRLADRHKLTACDASYLWLAIQFDAELITLDRELEREYAAQG